MGAINTLATAITSFANYANLTFPNVTLPDFEVRGSDVRVLADAVVLHWMPIITDATRLAWEEYAYNNRFQIDEAFERDAELRAAQDEQFGYTNDRTLEETDPDPNILDDGSMYHRRIWSNNGRGVDADGSGPYMVAWQRSPVNGLKQELLNMNFATAKLFVGVLPAMMRSNEVTLARSLIPIRKLKPVG